VREDGQEKQRGGGPPGVDVAARKVNGIRDASRGVEDQRK